MPVCISSVRKTWSSLRNACRSAWSFVLARDKNLSLTICTTACCVGRREREGGGGGGGGRKDSHYRTICCYATSIADAYLQLFLKGMVLSRRIEMKQKFMTPGVVCVSWREGGATSTLTVNLQKEE